MPTARRGTLYYLQHPTSHCIPTYVEKWRVGSLTRPQQSEKLHVVWKPLLLQSQGVSPSRLYLPCLLLFSKISWFKVQMNRARQAAPQHYRSYRELCRTHTACKTALCTKISTNKVRWNACTPAPPTGQSGPLAWENGGPFASLGIYYLLLSEYNLRTTLAPGYFVVEKRANSE